MQKPWAKPAGNSAALSQLNAFGSPCAAGSRQCEPPIAQRRERHRGNAPVWKLFLLGYC